MTQAETVEALMQRHGRTFCDELGIDIEANAPSALFRWLVACILFSAPIRWSQSVEAAQALSDAGWRTAERMASATWEERVRVLNRNGYARYDERTSRILEDAARHVQDEYKGDLRRLREAAGEDPEEERRLLKAVKGLGDVGVDIFFREAQAAWGELRPFADKTALKAAKRLGLPGDAEALAQLVDERDFVRLVAALTRAELENEGAEEIAGDAG